MPRAPAFRKPPMDWRANAAGLSENVDLFFRSTPGAEEPERETSMASIKILATAICLLASTAAFADDPLPRAKPEDDDGGRRPNAV